MPFSIGIAGAGVAGLTAALLLAQQGHTVTIHEQSPQLGPVGAGVLLQPSGQRALRALNLLDSATKNAEPIDRLCAFTHKRKILIDLPYSELHDARAYGLPRHDLFTTLHTAALAAGVTITTAHRIQRYLHSNDKVLLDTGPAHLGPYDFILAADGANSLLRKNSPVKSHTHPYPHGALWTTGPCTTIQNRLFQISHGTKILCGILPTGQSRASLFWGMPYHAMPSLRDRGFESWRNQVLTLCPEAKEILAPLTTFDSTQFVNYCHVHMPRPYDQHCLFLGDAAHAMSPHLGQGINLALIDGYLFARAMALHKTFPAACLHYTHQRAHHLRAYRIITRALSPFFQSKGFIKGWGRDLFLPLMPKFPPLRKQMILTMSGCRKSLAGGHWHLPQ